jgi:hypothetical protein
MPVLLKLRLPLSTDFGNAMHSTRGSRAPKPVTSARRAPDNADFVGIKTYSPLGFDRTQNNEAGAAWRGFPWQCSRHPSELFDLGGAALPATSLCVCMDFAVRAACFSLKENKVMSPAHPRGTIP